MKKIRKVLIIKLYSRSFISGFYLQNSIGINLESHLDLRYASEGRWDPGQLELAKEVIIPRQSAFSFVNLN